MEVHVRTACHVPDQGWELVFEEEEEEEEAVFEEEEVPTEDDDAGGPAVTAILSSA